MAETTAHTEAPAGHTKFPPFDSEQFPSQLVWLAISFDLAAAEQLKEQSNAAQAAYEKALADARGRAQTIAGATHDQQARETEQLHKRLEAQLHDRITAAEQSIAKSRGAAMSNVKSIAAEITSAIVERLIGQRPRDEEVAAALRDTGKR